MKNSILFIPFFLCSLLVSGQTVFSENFNGLPVNSIPPQWQVSSSTDVHNYEKPFACTQDLGLQTPAVGKNAPSRMILPEMQYDSAKGITKITFTVFVMDPNLRCNTVKEFPCPTYVDAMLVRSNYTGGTNSLPDASDIYAQQSYRINIANGSNTIIFNFPDIKEETYLIYLNFKTAASSNCTGAGTKFVFDDFTVEELACDGDCPPVANDDYFNGRLQGFIDTIKANVYGGFLLWSSACRAGYERRSLSTSPAVNNGLDYDANNHSLELMRFVKVGADVIYSNNSCDTLNLSGEVIWNGDGSFEYVRLSDCITRLTFQYKIIDPGGLESNVATVTVDFRTLNVLPVTLTGFTAKGNGNYVTLDWKTSYEYMAAGFYVQRNTGDGWKDRTFLPAGNSGKGVNSGYSYIDTNYFIGLTQYRLKMVDIDGRYEYSNVCLVRRTRGLDFLAYPNPSTNGQVTVELPGEGNYAIEVFNTSGSRVAFYPKVTSRINTISGLKPGMYVIRIKEAAGGAIGSLKLVVL